MAGHNVDEKRSRFVISQALDDICVGLFAILESEIMNFEDILCCDVVLFREPSSCLIAICLSLWHLGIGLIE